MLERLVMGLRAVPLVALTLMLAACAGIGAPIEGPFLGYIVLLAFFAAFERLLAEMEIHRDEEED